MEFKHRKSWKCRNLILSTYIFTTLFLRFLLPFRSDYEDQHSRSGKNTDSALPLLNIVEMLTVPNVSFACSQIYLCIAQRYLPELFNHFFQYASNVHHRRTGTFGFGGRWPYWPKKITQFLKAWDVHTHSNRSKSKNVLVLTSNKTIIIPKTKRNSHFGTSKGNANCY